MNRLYQLLTSVFMVLVFVGCNTYDDAPITEKLDDIDRRVDIIENVIGTMNSDISSIMGLLEIQRQNLTIVSVKMTNSGYVLLMNDGSSLILPNGKDGNDGKDGLDGKDGNDGKDGLDGKDGEDGADGATPIIGVEQDGGMYYWTITINGVTEFLLDANGDKIPANGRDGKDGVNGKDGNNGSVLAVQILLRINVNSCLEMSYDNGLTWIPVLDSYGNPVKIESGSTEAIVDVYQDGDYYVFVLANGNAIRIKTCACNNTGIPSDDVAGAAPTFPDSEINTLIPNVSCVPSSINGVDVYKLNLTGIQNPIDNTYLDLVGTGLPTQNVWVDVDKDPKGNTVVNVTEKAQKIDLVFLVDNSGTMAEEADVVARDIIAWATSLESSGLDIKFGCVGYDGRVNGAINITTAQELAQFLNYSTGTSRTMHFGGTDATYLESQKGPYQLASQYENGVAALRFADKFFNFREGSNRIYVNFTDENNEVQGRSEFSVETLKTDWDTNQGTVHTVFSTTTKPANYPGVSENPWLMSEYTGGTTIFTNQSFTGVTLESLPVTDAMKHSSSILITNLGKLFDGKPHELRITVMTPDQKVKARRTFSITFTREK